MTWFGRNDLILAAIIAHTLRIQNRIVSIGSGPIDWLMALHPRVEGLLLVDRSAEVIGLLEAFKKGSAVSLAEIEALCRNAPELPNTDLGDDAHLAMGLQRLRAAGVLPEGWTVESLRTKGIIMPEAARAKVSILGGDAYRKASEFLDATCGHNVDAPYAEYWDIVQLSNVVHEMEKTFDAWCMDDFYRMLRGAVNAPGTVHIHTPVSHFFRTETGFKDRLHLCDQLGRNGIRPKLVVLVDAVISSQGTFRGNYSICAESAPSVDLPAWTAMVREKYDVDIELREITLAGKEAWEQWQSAPQTALPLAMVNLTGDKWIEARICWKDLERLLGQTGKLTFGRNFHDGYRLFNPQAPI